MVTTAMARPGSGSLQVSSIGDLMDLAKILYTGRASLMPNVDRPEKVFAILLAGMEIGLAPNQALDSIMMGKNGRLSIWGDGALALVRASGLLESIEEWVDGEGEARTGHCKATRKGEKERHYTFSIADANRAGLIERARGKNGDGPWITYQDRMLVMRPRGFLLRDVFPDVLRGLITAEEAQDMEPAATAAPAPVVRQADVVNTTATPAAAPTAPATPEPEPKPLPAAAADPAGPVTDEQLKEILVIKTNMMAGRGITSPTIQNGQWQTFLEESYHVKSAREFTREQAARFIAAEGPKHDPFGHPTSTAASQT